MISMDGFKATYSAKGTGGVFVTVEGLLVRIVSPSGSVSIETANWPDVKQMIDEAIAHYQAIEKETRS